METRNLEISSRETTGKGEAGRLKRRGAIPAVFYGAGKKTVSITLNPKEFMEAIDTDAGINTLITLNAKDNKELDKKVVILKDKQLDPITKKLIHLDLYEIVMDKMIEVDIPVVCLGKPIGIEKGGILQIVQREIKVECLPTNIPEKIEIDVSPLDIGDAIHIKDITAPEGVSFKFETNFTIVTVASPMKEEVAAAAVTEVPVEGAVPVEGVVPAAGEVKVEGGAPAKDGDKAAKGAPEKGKAPADKGKVPGADKKGKA